jgi:hypothetical protein
MGSGEADITSFKIPYHPTVGTIQELNHSSSITNGGFTKSTSNSTVDISGTTWWYPQSYYYYQIFCPKKTCKTANWCQLDIIQPCTNCGARIKAVMDVPDYVVPVTR